MNDFVVTHDIECSSCDDCGPYEIHSLTITYQDKIVYKGSADTHLGGAGNFDPQNGITIISNVLASFGVDIPQCWGTEDFLSNMLKFLNKNGIINLDEKIS